MSPSLRDPHKHNVKHTTIVADLRRRIVTGFAPPGSRLPNRAELQEQFGASTATVQQAFNCLIDDGFVDVRGVRGSYVSVRPPHLCHYGLIHEERIDAGSQFWMALCNEAVKIAASAGGRASVYYDITRDGDGEDQRRLMADIRAHRLAGLVFLHSPFKLAGSPVLTEPGVERVALMSRNTIDGVPAVWVDELGFIEQALGIAAAHGRQRVAVLRNVGLPAPDSYWHRWSEMVASRGMETRPYWHLAVPHLDPTSARQVVHLLMNERQQERPDALIIDDDNLVEAATAGLIAAGCSVPRDLEVIAHTNFPWPTRSHVPATRLGFDVRQILRTAFDAIDSRRCGQDVPPVTLVPVVDDGGKVLTKD